MTSEELIPQPAPEAQKTVTRNRNVTSADAKWSTKRTHQKRHLPKALKVTAKVMRDRGASQRDIAAELNISLEATQRALRDPNVDPKFVQKVKQTLDVAVSSKLGDLILKISEHMDNPEAIAKLGLYHSALILAILVDKKRLLDGQSTENISVSKTLALQINDELGKVREAKRRFLESIETTAR